MKTTIVTILLVLLPFCALFAQEDLPSITVDDIRDLSDSEWQMTVSDLKSKAATLLEENEKLNTEYQFLKEKLSGVQGKIKILKDETQAQEQENVRLRKLRDNHIRTTSASKDDFDNAHKTIANIEEENAELRQELQRIKEENQEWQTRLSKLQSERRERVLDLKMQEFAKEDLEIVENDEIKKLKASLRKYELKNEELSQKAQQLREQRDSIPGEIQDVKDQNLELETQLASLQRKREEQGKQNERLKKEIKELEISANQMPSDMVAEKREIEKRIAKLENQINSIKKSVTNSTALIDKKRKLMNEVIFLDAQNQEIRAKITGLLEEVSSLKQEITTLEEVLPLP